MLDLWGSFGERAIISAKREDPDGNKFFLTWELEDLQDFGELPVLWLDSIRFETACSIREDILQAF